MGADRALLIAGDDAELDADRVARILAGVVKTRVARPGADGQAGGRRRRQPGRPAAGRLPELAPGHVPGQREAGGRRQVRHRHPRGRRRRRGEARAAAGGADRRPAHHRQEGRPQRRPGPGRGRVGGEPALRLAEGDHGGQEEGDQRGDPGELQCQRRGRRNRPIGQAHEVLAARHPQGRPRSRTRASACRRAARTGRRSGRRRRPCPARRAGRSPTRTRCDCSSRARAPAADRSRTRCRLRRKLRLQRLEVRARRRAEPCR